MKAPKNLKETTAKNTRMDIANLMGWLECEIAKQPEKPDWAQIGDLKRLRNNLLEALTAISGLRTDEIENSLEEARIR